MLDQHRELTTEMNRIHNPIVLRAPPEIASHIFQLCISRTNNESPESLNKLVQSVLGLSAVCRDWRHIACSTPQLWTTVPICFGAIRLLEHHRTIQQWFNRSKALPISIYAYDSKIKYLEGTVGSFDAVDTYRDVATIVRTMSEHSYRWKRLDICIPSRYSPLFDTNVPYSLSSFRSLKLESSDSTYTARYRMKHLSPTDVTLLCVPADSLAIKWNNVTRVDVTLINLDECFTLLQEASKLVHCRFSGILPSSELSSLLVDPIIHPTVQYFELERPCLTETEDTGSIFERTAFPALRILKLSMNEEYLPEESLSSFFSRSSCQLQELYIHNTGLESSTFVTFLEKVPSSLAKLDISPTTNCDHSPEEFFKTLAQSRIRNEDAGNGQFLPNLEILKYQANPIKPFPWTLIPPVFGPVGQWWNLRRRPLDSFHIHFAQYNPPTRATYIDMSVIPSLLALKEIGVDLRIVSETSDGDIEILEPCSEDDL
ncbi:hypothetical protein CPB84DRAFT_1786404 [Gymnopilus junonius]|uniref:F-box domain-containing protein n=1 Tax=Gymnopilus junonius TaxID=109634 RepID=A0A9P5NHB3_GYMJU|nr:hypothetical protein CPB84DRAFT_1786404 [Gymnopilus junonius]